MIPGDGSLATPTPPSASQSTIPCTILHAASQNNAALDARHTHTRPFGFILWDINIDMVCELSAALLCLCKKSIKVCAKNLRIFFLFASSSCLISSSSYSGDSKPLLLGLFFFCFADGILIFLVLLGIGDDETHILGDNLLETIGAGVSKKSCGALR